MLAVVVAPRGFTTARMSEASIVPRASPREIALTACLGRVLGAEPQVRCRWFDSHSYSYSFVSHAPSKLGGRLSSHPAFQHHQVLPVRERDTLFRCGRPYWISI